MKRLLILTYYWPPGGGAGVQRWLKFTKYLRDFGWEPVVYTAADPSHLAIDQSLARDIPPGIQVLRRPVWEPYEAYRSLLGRDGPAANPGGLEDSAGQAGLGRELSRWIRGNLFVPDARCFWIRPSARFLARWLAVNPVDAMASTGPPHSMHLIARALKRRLGIPWLADFRDPWTRVFYNDHFHMTAAARRWHMRLERAVLAEADTVVSVGRAMKDDFNRILPRRYEVLTNGFDPDDFAGAPAVSDAAFTLNHLGTFMASRNHDALWRVLGRLAGASAEFARDLRVRITGRVDASVLAAVRANGLERNLEVKDYVPHAEATADMRRAAVLLLMINKARDGSVIVPGKLFEYLAARRPVLCLGPTGGEAAEIVTATGAGVAIDPEDEAALECRVAEMYRHHRAGTLGVDGGDIEGYSRRSLTGRLAGLLDEMVIPHATASRTAWASS